MRVKDLLALLRASLRNGGRSLDPVTKLAKVLIEEHEDGDGLVLPLIEPALHEVEVLVAVEDPDVEGGQLFGEPAEDGQIRHDIAAPVLRQGEDAQRLRQRLECPYRLWIEGEPTFVLSEALLVARHRGFE